MQIGLCGSSSNESNNQQINLFFAQTESPLTIPFGAGTETTVLTVPVEITSNLQPVLINGMVQMQFNINPQQGSQAFQHGVRLRIRRNGILLFTKSLQQGSPISSNQPATSTSSIPISIVDNNTVLGTDTYTVTLEFFQRVSNQTSAIAQSRSLNALTV
jgi:hypothetical protein